MVKAFRSAGALLLAASIAVGARDSKKVFELLERGSKLSARDANNLEEKLRKKTE